MSHSTDDRKLGMGRRITRRDFLNGVAVGVGALGVDGLPGLPQKDLPQKGLAQESSAPEGSANSSHSATGAGRPSAPYPPAETGLRGSQPGSFDVAHALRDGTFWDDAGTPTDTHDSYDLIVV
jgi:spermidine dehydrogenase